MHEPQDRPRSEAPGNPLRSEAAMFRLFVWVALAALPVIVVGLVAGPLWGALVLLFELGVCAGAAVRALRARRG